MALSRRLMGTGDEGNVPGVNALLEGQGYRI